ncbi:unnamed protein product [Prunus armeniaca]|uniref:Uncharacterized protein n=1 Tax=Prunus armeniaca TaxID=36596 RepID=A0A6J5V1I9_PRUAR|nr:unnamed protein product [Prunus armeniaca]
MGLCGLRALFSVVGFGGPKILANEGDCHVRVPRSLVVWWFGGLMVMVAIEQASRGAVGASWGFPGGWRLDCSALYVPLSMDSFMSRLWDLSCFQESTVF